MPTPSPTDLIAALGRASLAGLAETGRMGLFALRSLASLFVPVVSLGKTVRQLSFIGVKSVGVIALIGLFTGMVLGLQGYYTLVKFGSEGLLGAAVALSVIRELGPVLTAIMITARAGSSMAAEIGVMRISEQIDALSMMNVSPMAYLVAPRLAAGILSFPLLTAMFDTIAIFGGYLSGCLLLGVNSGIYFDRVSSAVEWADVSGGFTKSLVFGLLVVLFCCERGYHVHLREGGFGAKGVGLATTSAVVSSCVAVLVSDYILTSFLL